MPDEVIFTEVATEHGVFDMTINGRAGEYDVLFAGFDEAIRRRRVPPDANIWVHHNNGQRSRMTGRR